MSQQPSPTDNPASRIAERPIDFLADIDLIPDDWNRGAPDNPCPPRTTDLPVAGTNEGPGRAENRLGPGPSYSGGSGI
jgi:hypothetical protein